MTTSGNEQIDAVRKYIAGLKPQIRLDYYDLSPAERSFIRAMLSKSRNGVAVFASLNTLSQIANISRKTAQRLVNGYTTREGRKVIGLKARAIITESAPANSRERRCATFQVNWDAFTIDPRRMGELERRLQLTLPGMKTPPVPDEPEPQDERGRDDRSAQNAARDELTIPLPFVQKAVERQHPPTDKMSIASGQNGQGLRSNCPGTMDKMAGDYGQNVQGATDKMSTNLEYLNLGSDLGVDRDSDLGKKPDLSRGVAKLAVETSPSEKQKAGGFKNKGKSAWEKLHPGLMAKLKRQLDLMAEGQAGTNTYGWTPEAIAGEWRRTILIAADQAGIWVHVAQELAEEGYQAQLEKELNKSCRVCGCTAEKPCVLEGEKSCGWMALRLCSNPVCVAQAQLEQRRNNGYDA